MTKIKKEWIDMEMEHTRSRKRARQIVKDHIKEHGPRYYPDIIKLGKKLRKRRRLGKKLMKRRR